MQNHSRFKYSWASIVESTSNYGNQIIVYNLLKKLEEKGFGAPAFSFDAYRADRLVSIDSINSTQFLIIPGCTTLTLNHYPALETIIKSLRVTVPIYNIGATFMTNTSAKWLKYYRQFFQPIGIRDPASNAYLQKNKFISTLIGCPTLFTGNAQKFKNRTDGPILFIAGVEKSSEQAVVLDWLLDNGYELTTLIQQEDQRGFFNGKNVKVLEYSAYNLIKEIDRSRLVVTGRLHGALPAIARGVPVMFLNTFDDLRFSLLNYIGIELFQLDRNIINKVQNVIQNPIPKNEKEIFHKVNILRDRFDAYLDLILEDIAKL
jgi:hypothetical protein